MFGDMAWFLVALLRCSLWPNFDYRRRYARPSSVCPRRCFPRIGSSPAIYLPLPLQHSGWMGALTSEVLWEQLVFGGADMGRDVVLLSVGQALALCSVVWSLVAWVWWLCYTRYSQRVIVILYL